MSEAEHGRSDFKIRELLTDPHDIELFNRGSILGSRYDHRTERQGTFADEVTSRLEGFAAEHAEDEQLIRKPAFVLGVVSSVSARREDMKEAEILARVAGWEGSE
jgi:hypothetical protein